MAAKEHAFHRMDASTKAWRQQLSRDSLLKYRASQQKIGSTTSIDWILAKSKPAKPWRKGLAAAAP
jgi:hypothetical protein